MSSGSQDCSSFLSVYRDIGGPKDAALNSSNCCSWKPNTVRCGPDGRINWLDLSYQNLTGAIPESISKLSSLGLVAINGNPELKGPIPTSIGQLASLYYLSLRNNPKLNGSIPDSMSWLYSLRVLDVTGTGITGALPQGMADLRLTRDDGVSCPYPSTVCVKSGSAIPLYCSPSLLSVCAATASSSTTTSSNAAILTKTRDPVIDKTLVPSPSPTSTPDQPAGPSDPFTVRSVLSPEIRDLILVCGIALLFFIGFGLSLYYCTLWNRRRRFQDPHDKSANVVVERNLETIASQDTIEVDSTPKILFIPRYLNSPQQSMFQPPPPSAPVSDHYQQYAYGECYPPGPVDHRQFYSAAESYYSDPLGMQRPSPVGFTMEDQPLEDPLSHDGPYYYDEARNAYFRIKRAESSVFYGNQSRPPTRPPSRPIPEDSVSQPWPSSRL
ncbi:hypothetical protein HDV03_002429 [Kappamyces sp. JEL0829]|nr:hypothetical protein HDV03_002429 [Kappamyces sp. JEL0829]